VTEFLAHNSLFVELATSISELQIEFSVTKFQFTLFYDTLIGGYKITLYNNLKTRWKITAHTDSARSHFMKKKTAISNFKLTGTFLSNPKHKQTNKQTKQTTTKQQQQKRREAWV